VADVAEVIADAPGHYDAILLDVDNGPDALAHDTNDGLYRPAGIRAAKRALRPGGTLGVWSFSDDPRFTKDLRAAGFEAQAHRVEASRKGRGRHHIIWIARAVR
jgi:spermidine synthase